MLHPVFAPGKIALITGAASGVGLAVARLCRKHGMKLALVDRNMGPLALLKEEFLKDGGPLMEAYAIDVSQLSEWEHLRTKVGSRFGSIDFLMLNAGIMVKGTWEETEYFEKVL